MDLARLKAETAPDHDRVEGSLHVMAEDLDTGEYVVILGRLYGFIKGWEQWAGSVSVQYLQRDLAERQRSSLLASDLSFFSSSLPDDLYEGPLLSPNSTADVLGAMYVIEGSTLGGQYIAQHLERHFGLVEGRGNSYFRGYGPRTGEMWQSMRALMKQVPEAQEDAVIHAAKVLFSDFAAWNVNAQGSRTKGTIHVSPIHDR